MNKNILTRTTQVKQIFSYSKRTGPQSQQSKQRPPRRPRPHGHPRPDRYRPPARYMLDVGKHASLAITLQQRNITVNALTVAKIGGKDE